MKHERWIGSNDWETINESINGNLSFNERCHTETQDLDDLIHWLEYANTGYPAARQTVDQEEYWAKLLRGLLCEKLIKELHFLKDGCAFEFRCSKCNKLVRGLVYNKDKECPVSMAGLCSCLTPRIPDICVHILNKYEALNE